LASVFAFDTSRLDEQLTRLGLEGTWKALLARKVLSSGEKFRYILDSPFLKGATPLEVDILDELSIGEISVLYEYCVANVDASSRKDNGQFFTPDDVADLMVREAVQFPSGKWLDPCSGIGNLAWHLVNAQDSKERFLSEQLILSDKDGLALEIARVLFTLSFQDENKDLYNQIQHSFVKFDFLSVADSGEAALFGSGQLEAIPDHDFVIVNPPYLGLKREDPRFESSKAKDLYAYFLENIIKTSSGFVSVTPQSFTNAGKFSSTRRLLLSKFSSLKIYAFDNIPGNIFYGVKFGSSNTNTANSIRAAIMVARKDGNARKITSLLRWKTSERKVMFSRLSDFLSEAPLTEDGFPKVSSVFQGLYKDLLNKPTLGELLSNAATEHVLYVPAAPRYFISALKSSVDRASMKTLYFRSEDDLNCAYLLLNSSLMYWWWRVRDGGMTLALETIKTLPVPRFQVMPGLVAKLERSETSNKVYKMNAGALHENVKHDLSLVSELNDLVAPQFSKRLLKTHENSELVQLPKKSARTKDAV
jgi:hypothetical protein